MNRKKILSGMFCTILFISASMAQEQEDLNIRKVHVIFKTHFDLGYTDLSSVVAQRYIDNFIPKAIEVAAQLRAEGGKERYIWTTGAWLVHAYLQQASPEAVKSLEEAIHRGDIEWNAAPYTIESESTGKDLFEAMWRLSKRLDDRYGKKTVAAKMTDVPGHTRSVITPMYDAGIRFLNIGVNNCSTVPEVPLLCRWQNTDGKEIILMYQTDYGGETILPDSLTVVSIHLTGDNHGPHTAEQVKAIYAGLRKRYPNAEIVASSLNKIAEEIWKMAGQLPVLTSEIGDTWIFGYASSPLTMARYRALMRLYSEWLQTGKLDKNSDTAIDFTVQLGLVAEHTWGVDHLVHIRHWDKYDVDIFNASRDLPEFRKAERSWQEIADRLDEAIALLPDSLQREALAVVKSIGQVKPLVITKKNDAKQLNWAGAFRFSHKGAECLIGEVAYQTYSADDYEQYVKDYIRANCGNLWYYFTKPGLEESKARSATLVARKDRVASKKEGKKEIIDCQLSFPADWRIDSRVLPQQVHTQYVVSKEGNAVEMTVSLINKPAVRLPEAYWVSFFPSDIIAVFADKIGMPVDVMDIIVKGGNRQMHGIDRYIDMVTGQGILRITSLDAPVVAIGERRAMNYSLHYPDLNGGVHFCLFNNLWTTNFIAWWEGSLAYRFKIEYLPDQRKNKQ